MAPVVPFAVAPWGSLWAVGGARVVILVVHGANFEGTFSVVLLDTITALVVARGSVGSRKIAGARLLVAGGMRMGRRMCLCVLGCVPVVVGTHGRAIRVRAGVVLDHVTGEGIAAGGSITADDSWDDVATVGLLGLRVRRVRVRGLRGSLLLPLTARGIFREGAVDGLLGEDVADALVILLTTKVSIMEISTGVLWSLGK